ncbi:MAG: ribosome recycling factor [Planctomycetota bacterium]|nr:MAG: ribosome recycling factor [Planctomycetota bacterium]
MGYDDVLLEAEERMEKSVEVLKGEYRGMRTGRAHAGLVDSIRVEYFGSPTPLKQLAQIMVPEANQIVIKPFDPSSVGDIERAILKSELGITPNSDGKVVRLTVPPLSEQRRKQLVSQAKERAEAARVSIRNVRRDANKQAQQLQSSSEITEDDLKKLKQEIDDLTRKYVGIVDKLLENKTEELMEV